MKSTLNLQSKCVLVIHKATPSDMNENVFDSNIFDIKNVFDFNNFDVNQLCKPASHHTLNSCIDV